MRHAFFPVVLVAAVQAFPVHAAEWAMIDSVETKGDRSIYYADYSEVTLRNDVSLTGVPVSGKPPQQDDLPPAPFENTEVAFVEVMQVFESALKPRYSNYRVAADCARHRMQIVTVDSIFRDHRKEYSRQGTGWFDVPPDGWLSRVNTIACDRQAIVAATEKAARDKSYDPMVDLGLLPIGNFALSSPLEELTWSTFWTDATPPPLRQQSEEEIRAVKQRVDEMLVNLRSQLDGYIAMGELALADQTDERNFMARILPNFRGKTRLQQAIFGSMAGWTEAEVIKFWGRPAAMRQVGTTKAFDYESSYDTRQLIVQQLRTGNVEYEVGDFEYCALTLFMAPGGSKPGLRLVDFAISGDNCRRATLNQIGR